MKAKTHLEMYLVKDMIGNKKSFYSYISSNMKTREKARLLLNGMRALVTKEVEKPKVLNAFFISPLQVRPAFRNQKSLRLEESLEQGRITLDGGGSR